MKRVDVDDGYINIYVDGVRGHSLMQRDASVA